MMAEGNGDRERGRRKGEHSGQNEGKIKRICFESISELLKIYDEPESDSDEDESEREAQGKRRTAAEDDQENLSNKLKMLFKTNFIKSFLKSEFYIGYKLGIVIKKIEKSRLTPREAAEKAVELFEDFISYFLAKENETTLLNLYNPDFSRDELILMSCHLKEKLSEILSEEEEPLYKRVILRLSTRYPDQDFQTYHKLIKDFLEDYPSYIDLNIATNLTTAQLLCLSNDHINNKETTEPPEFQEFPLVAPEEGKYHDFESPESHHYYIASSQYYKMLHHNVASRNKITIQNKPNSIQSIEHIVNKKTLDIYNQMKKTFKEQGKVTEDKKVRELLLFHATDAKNIDSILQNGFNIDHDPQHKKKKMVFGRGVYFSEHPEISFFYGNKILLCKVLPGNVEKLEMPNKPMEDIQDGFDSRELLRDCIGYIHVIKEASQILPYCVINLTNGTRGGQKKESQVGPPQSSSSHLAPSGTSGPLPGPSGVQHSNGRARRTYIIHGPHTGPSGMKRVEIAGLGPVGGGNILGTKPRQKLKKYLKPMFEKIRTDPIKWRKLHILAKIILDPGHIDTKKLEKIETWLKKHVMGEK